MPTDKPRTGRPVMSGRWTHMVDVFIAMLIPVVFVIFIAILSGVDKPDDACSNHQAVHSFPL